MAKVEVEAPAAVVAEEKPSLRVKIVELIFSLNVLLLLITSVANVGFASYLAPKGSDLTATRVSGGFGIVYALLIKSLGPQHHGQYCLTFVLHFVLASIYGYEAFQQRSTMGSDQWLSLALPTAVHYTMFSFMILLLVNGGLGGKKHDSKKKH